MTAIKWLAQAGGFEFLRVVIRLNWALISEDVLLMVRISGSGEPMRKDRSSQDASVPDRLNMTIRAGLWKGEGRHARVH
jgi:hypothetical protein